MKIPALLLLALAVACGDSPAPASGDAAVLADAAAGQPDAAAMGNCPFSGVYTLESYSCGAMDITAAWKTAIPTESFTFSSDPAGCKLDIRHQSATCIEEESVTFAPGGTMFNYSGVTSCNPAMCTFSANDAACMTGDRVRMRAASATAEGAKIRLRAMENGNVCGAMETIVVLAR